MHERVISMVALVMTVMSVAVLIPVMPTTVAAVVVAVLVRFALFPALSLHFAFALMILIVTLIFRVVFPRFHEVHRPIASVVFLAVLAPIFCMTRRDVQIDGRRRYELRLDQHGLCVDDSRWTLVADTDLTIYAWDDLPGQHDPYVEVTRATYTGAGDQQC
jgi:hypothetical protein